jgi:aminopeptidase N
MEYPTLFTTRTRLFAPPAVNAPEDTVLHEAGHQWFQSVVATNEFEHAWMDEGLTLFAEARAIDALELPNRLELRFFGGFVPWVAHDIRRQRATQGNRLATYRAAPEGDTPATPSFRYWVPTAGPQIYDKAALWLYTLERHLGWTVVQRILATYYERWQFRHPQPEHFFAIANEVSGQDLTWFFDQVHLSSNTFDYAAGALSNDRADDGTYRVTVAAERRGEAIFPVEVVTTFEDGAEAREQWDGRERRAVYVYERAAPAVTLQVDPRRVLLLDVDYTNNSRTTRPRAGEASLKWSLAWMTWLQELMVTYAFFV